MATTKITDLTAYTDPVSTDVLPIVDVTSDVTKKVSIADLMENAGSGSAAAPGISFDGDPNTGIYRPGADQIGVATNGTARVTVSTTAVSSALPVDVLLGAAATPSYTFTGDTNTGIYSPGADQVAISTNGTGRLFIDASGNVGVGQSGGARGGSGTRFLSKLASGQSFIEVQANGTADANALIFSDGSTGNYGAYGYDHSNDSAYIQTAGQTRLTIDSSGRLGLGTSSPGTGTSSYYDDLVIKNDGSGTGAGITIQSNSTNGFSGLDLRKADGTELAKISASASTGKLAIDAAGTTAITIDSSQRVGIGTSSPTYKLEVGTTSDAVNHISIKSSTTGSAHYYFSDTNNGQAGISYNHSTDVLTIRSNDAAAITVDSSQRVGIGTTSPTQLLEVGGSVGNIQLASSGAEITFTRNGPSFITASGASGSLGFQTGGTNERARIDSSGRLLVGTTIAYGEYVGASSGYFGTLQIARNTFDGVAQFSNWTSNTGLDSHGGTQLFISRCKSGTVGSHTGGALSSGNPIGRLIFNTSDGTNFRSSAYITAEVDGAVSTADVPGRLVFSTTAAGASSPTENMRIYSNRNVRFGTVGTSYGVFDINNDGSSTYKLDYLSSGGNRLFAVQASNGTAVNSTGTYTTVSDAKLKENIVESPSQWQDIKALRVVKYNFKEEAGYEQHTQLGLIAQEVEEVSPGLVFDIPDTDADGVDLGTVTKGVKQSIVYMKAVKALQEAMERIEQLESEMAEVKAQLQAS